MVRGQHDFIYARLAERYNTLIEKERAAGLFFAPRLPVKLVVRDQNTAREGVFVVEWSADYHSSPGVHVDCVVGQGTAFAYSELNLLVTCSHVFESTAQIGNEKFSADFESLEIIGGKINVVRPGERGNWPVKIVYRNRQFDVAILQFEGGAPPHKYFAAIDSPIAVHSDGVLIGFPEYKNWNLPDFNHQKVLNRTFPHKDMSSFTVANTGSIRPGNSGGPFVDVRYRVAGMAQRGAYLGVSHDECLCFEVLDRLIEDWRSRACGTTGPHIALRASAMSAPVLPEDPDPS
jgi:S1-C subfamily serine protease